MVTLADSADVNVGTDVLAIGYPACRGRDQRRHPRAVQQGRQDQQQAYGGRRPLLRDERRDDAGHERRPGRQPQRRHHRPGQSRAGRASGRRSTSWPPPRSSPRSCPRTASRTTSARSTRTTGTGSTPTTTAATPTPSRSSTQVLATVPSHAQAQEYRQKAVSLRETEGEGHRRPSLLVDRRARLAAPVVAVRRDHHGSAR